MEAASGGIIANVANSLPLADWLNTIDNIIKLVG